jgi:hypothetical protein
VVRAANMEDIKKQLTILEKLQSQAITDNDYTLLFETSKLIFEYHKLMKAN